ncbi:MAG: hypothetical protein WA634_13665 [Silvibacterium sp.]
MSAPQSPRWHALRVAAQEAVLDAVGTEYAVIRAEAEAAFADMLLEEGTDRVAVLLPDGEKLDRITVKGGTPDVSWNGGQTATAALLDWCREHFPAAIEEYIDPSAAASVDVVEAVRDKVPGVIRERVRPATAKHLAKEIEESGGFLKDRRTDEPEQVATVTETVTGAFSFTGNNAKERRARIMAALLAGELPGVISFGPLALPVAYETPDDEAAPEPEMDLTSHLRPPFGAAAHAVMVQGGFSTPPIEAYRMIRSGGVAAERARVWLAEVGLDPADPAEGKNTPWPLPAAEAGTDG